MSEHTFNENLELSKALTASAWERLGNLNIAKGGPGSGPHKGGGGGRDPLAQRAGEILSTMGKTTITDKIEAHDKLASDHFIARNKALESGKEDQAKAHDLAGKGHMSAADAWRAYGRNEGGESTAVQRTQAATGKSNRAAEA